VASSYYIGVLDGTPGWQKGRKSRGSCSRQLLSWRAPISSMPEPTVTGLKMKSPDVNPGDQVIRDRRNKDIAEDEGRDSHFPAGQRMRSGDSLLEHIR